MPLVSSIDKSVMNISLTKTKKKKKYGLVSSSAAAAAAGFGGGDDDDDSDDQAGSDDRRSVSGRTQVNRDIQAEQEALRKRAAAAALQQEQDSSIYDYDGAFESFSSQNQQQQGGAYSRHQAATAKEAKKSRYVEDLLKAAKRRNQERDIIHERKIAKEQAAEDAEFEGKDKFVTKAYRQKLAERELWAREEAEREEQEAMEDVTKKSGDAAMASFYGNLNRNVAMGGDLNVGERERDDKKAEDQDAVDRKDGQADERHPGLGFMDGFEMEGPHETETSKPAAASGQESQQSYMSPEMKERAMRKIREEKVAQARIRYFQRRGISAS